jgi:LuxR family maltose regulon positive regulatory protein
MSTPLLATKLFIPPPGKNLVVRPRLLEKLDQGLYPGCRLTLICAPAGFGKTTLVGSWIANLPSAKNKVSPFIAWFSLDDRDNDPVLFWTYLISALQTTQAGIGSEALSFIQSNPSADLEHFLVLLINDLVQDPNPSILILDDYHLIRNQGIHKSLSSLMERAPAEFHVFILSRTDPPLPLSLLRGRGQLVEIRLADLRFTNEEAFDYLHEGMTLTLPRSDIETLNTKTEGWAAGLQMAALSVRDRKDVSGFIEGFSGTNRYILDYLLEEVLASQSPEIQHFLLHTSILERLTAPLCEAVLGVEKLGDRNISKISATLESPHLLNSQEILEHLERANLFLVPLDDERIWFRYHNLFADLLHARFDQAYPGLAPQLHVRAAVWMEQAGMTVEAINHALAGDALDQAARLVEENTTRLLAQGEMNALMGWIDMLPAELRLARPWLCLHQASALMFAGRPGEVEPLLVQAELALGKTVPVPQTDKTSAPSMGTAEARALKGSIAAVRAFSTVMMGQDSEGLSQAQQARMLLTEGDPFMLSCAEWAIGRTNLNQGRLSEARPAFEEQARLGKAGGNLWALLGGMTYQAQVLQAQGQLMQARALLQEALAETSRQGARSRGFVAWVDVNLASVLYDLNELEPCNRLLDEAIELTRKWPNPSHLVYAYALKARILLIQGDLQGSRISISQVDQIRRNALLSRGVRRMAETELIRVWFALKTAGANFVAGDPLAGQAGIIMASWQSELASLADGEKTLTDMCAETAILALARVSLASGQADQALILLEPINRGAQAATHIGAAIASLILTALAWQGKPAGLGPALTALEQALELAKPGGYVRVFVDEGQPMQQLLALAIQKGIHPEYIRRLLAAYDHNSTRSPSQEAGQTHPPDLIEPLSGRELEVLRLIAAGLTNKEIAQRLYISLRTVKYHTTSILNKLNVNNRAHAAVRARELGLLK